MRQQPPGTLKKIAVAESKSPNRQINTDSLISLYKIYGNQKVTQKDIQNQYKIKALQAEQKIKPIRIKNNVDSQIQTDDNVNIDYHNFNYILAGGAIAKILDQEYIDVQRGEPSIYERMVEIRSQNKIKNEIATFNKQQRNELAQQSLDYVQLNLSGNTSPIKLSNIEPCNSINNIQQQNKQSPYQQVVNNYNQLISSQKLSSESKSVVNNQNVINENSNILIEQIDNNETILTQQLDADDTKEKQHKHGNRKKNYKNNDNIQNQVEQENEIVNNNKQSESCSKQQQICKEEVIKKEEEQKQDKFDDEFDDENDSNQESGVANKAEIEQQLLSQQQENEKAKKQKELFELEQQRKVQEEQELKRQQQLDMKIQLEQEKIQQQQKLELFQRNQQLFIDKLHGNVVQQQNEKEQNTQQIYYDIINQYLKYLIKTVQEIQNNNQQIQAAVDTNNQQDDNEFDEESKEDENQQIDVSNSEIVLMDIMRDTIQDMEDTTKDGYKFDIITTDYNDEEQYVDERYGSQEDEEENETEQAQYDDPTGPNIDIDDQQKTKDDDINKIIDQQYNKEFEVQADIDLETKYENVQQTDQNVQEQSSFSSKIYQLKLQLEKRLTEKNNKQTQNESNQQNGFNNDITKQQINQTDDVVENNAFIQKINDLKNQLVLRKANQQVHKQDCNAFTQKIDQLKEQYNQAQKQKKEMNKKQPTQFDNTQSDQLNNLKEQLTQKKTQKQDLLSKQQQLEYHIKLSSQLNVLQSKLQLINQNKLQISERQQKYFDNINANQQQNCNVAENDQHCSFIDKIKQLKILLAQRKQKKYEQLNIEQSNQQVDCHIDDSTQQQFELEAVGANQINDFNKYDEAENKNDHRPTGQSKDENNFDFGDINKNQSEKIDFDW